MQRKLVLSYLTLFFLTGLLVTSCKQELEDYVPKEFISPDASYLRIVNTASFPRRVDFFVNNLKVTGDSMGYNATYPIQEFLRVPSGNVTFKGSAAGNPNVVTSNLSFGAGKYHTLFVLDTVPTVETYLVTDDALLPPADSGKALIRFVNVAKGPATLTLANVTTATAVDTLFRNVGFKTHTDFVKVNAGSALKFQLYSSATPAAKIGPELTSVTLSANRIYTFYARGRLATGNAYPVSVSVMLNR